MQSILGQRRKTRLRYWLDVHHGKNPRVKKISRDVSTSLRDIPGSEKRSKKLHDFLPSKRWKKFLSNRINPVKGEECAHSLLMSIKIFRSTKCNVKRIMVLQFLNSNSQSDSKRNQMETSQYYPTNNSTVSDKFQSFSLIS